MKPAYESQFLNQHLEAAIDYLRKRNKYIVDGEFKPTNAVETNVTKTIKKYKDEMKKSKKSRETKASKSPVAIIYPKTIANP